DKQILFGDLHVHTTFSTDAFLWSLPIYGGEGAHPLADACDYARHCSALDFWSITDHAEAASPKRWEQTKQSIRACNAVSNNGDNPDNPDMVSFVGFEWTQVGQTPDEHFGHKNVIFKGLDDSELAKRPIASGGVTVQTLRTNGKNLIPLPLALGDIKGRQNVYDIRGFLQEAADVDLCDPNVPIAELPAQCFEIAETPGALVDSLEAQNLDPLIIPHGSTWGFYTPTTVTYDKHLKAENRPEKMELVEIMSGHGNSEEYRSFRAAVNVAPDALTADCPAPTPSYLPVCWRAGEIIKERCLADGESNAECEARAERTRNTAAVFSVAAHLSVPGTEIEEWLDAGQCRDCFLPSFGYRPGNSVQYALAIRNFDDPQNPARFNWGIIASSDNHRARPGTGYKEVDRLRTTEAVKVKEGWRERIYPKDAKSSEPLELDRDELMERGFGATEQERQASFWTTGGLAAVHAEGRSREEIFDAIKRRETYGTSGARILLWFNTKDGVPMGGTTKRASAPMFEVKAVGAHKQKPGCADETVDALGADRIQKLCANECFNPSNERMKITRFEVVRIRPQITEGENVDKLIEDPWKVIACNDNGNGCRATFSDPEFADSKRMATYYVRAIQEPSKKINADNLRCTYDDDGNCIEVNICYGDERTARDDNCLGDVEERAWSSPIYVEHMRGK
ncbi:MAG: DUF3604 domain-containing protein, partial [Alphaproteobacteria bacterium]|nr:DUF3604 domain-containing protein [Alphaproteobacteria bacterium]